MNKKEKFKSLEHLRKQENTKRISIKEYNRELDKVQKKQKEAKPTHMKK